MTLIISDLHNRYKALQDIINDVWDCKEDIIFLGDINDNSHPHDKNYSFIKTYGLVRLLVDSGKAQLLASNHQDKLIRYLKGNPIKPSNGMQQTIVELAPCRSDYKESLKTWLMNRPMVISLPGGFTLAHAYPSEHYGVCIYGPTIKTEGHRGARLNWWNCENLLPDFGECFISGHYHTLSIGDRHVVLDTDDEAVLWMRLPSKEYGIKLNY